MTLQAELQQYYGTEKYYRLNLTPIVATDGVKAFADKGSAYWAVDEMCFGAMKLKQPFLAVTITSKRNKATITYEDGNDNQLKETKVPWTDLETGTYQFYITDNVIMLTSEY